MDNNYSIYLMLFADKFKKENIRQYMNLSPNIGWCSFIYLNTYDYDFQDLFTELQWLDKKDISYPWSLHDIQINDYPLTECIDVILDTQKRRNNTTHYCVFENIDRIDKNYFDLIEHNRDKLFHDNFGYIKPINGYNGFMTSFHNFMINNKNNGKDIMYKLDDKNKIAINIYNEV